MNQISTECDVVVIGGGPAGASSAALLAQRGHRVLLLEREKFPRYHIGESLLTGCLPVIDQLGLTQRLDEAGFVKKYGSTLFWGKTKEPWDFRFSDARTHDFRFNDASKYDYAYQVRRAEFDALLLDRARECGVTVVEEAVVQEVQFAGNHVTGLSYRTGAGDVVQVAGRMVLDASGQSRTIARQLDLVEWHDDLRNVATWGYFKGCDYLDGRKAGDTVTENRRDGWLWFIPVQDDTVSVGYVTPVDKLAADPRSLDAIFDAERRGSSGVGVLTRDAVQIGKSRTIRDWSYCSTTFHGPGWALVGDAAAFVDPLLSTGVTLAMRAASWVAESVDEALREPGKAEEAMARYDHNYRTFFDQVLTFIRFFHNSWRTKVDYWEGAQQVVDPQRYNPPKADFAVLLSGLFGAQPDAAAEADAVRKPELLA